MRHLVSELQILVYDMDAWEGTEVPGRPPHSLTVEFIHTFLGYSGNCLCSTYLTFENHIIVPSRPKANFFFRYLAIFYKRIRQQESEHKPHA